MAAMTCELKWLKALLRSFDIFHKDPIHLYCNSKAALHISSNPIFLSVQNMLRLIATLLVIK